MSRQLIKARGLVSYTYKSPKQQSPFTWEKLYAKQKLFPILLQTPSTYTTSTGAPHKCSLNIFEWHWMCSCFSDPLDTLDLIFKLRDQAKETNKSPDHFATDTGKLSRRKLSSPKSHVFHVTWAPSTRMRYILAASEEVRLGSRCFLYSLSLLISDIISI